ncbi:MAG: TonB-dependent receptor, partial [Acidobacteria bacterium]
MSRLRRVGLFKIQFAVLALLLTFPLAVSAQVTTATIVGTVTDPSSAAVAGAQVTARNVDTGLSRTVTSGDGGNYRIEFLPVGNYNIEVTTTGFKKSYLAGIVLQVNDTIRVDVALTVGQVTETVTITEASPTEVNTSTPEIGRTIESAEIN